ncbi:MAG: 50S ribosomal protein L16 [Candidatus Lloydbacteria bacterium RIFCSPHIGHO2_02_FULL_51_22]|uniref:Large ribosomal subunit protein uL16 n=3 Tax=Candidatus Lloydiibacteriota TaxID=1817910 RepID=A0A1G2DB99_9BACT|nr:MAG: 50S ribosomal protein L16 [Candidatus Lloydbacteria bacterium RIFCSPHIGHO2_02_FULL_51_22]OGZ15790.1 MAG: 50S ribosomal protein L16 [Candidatus Lloydbacteria bacterium RIFCSPLOWO2_02_FULL_51_11]OGZ16977.1 MAG: 50S ribosomal protein L16 [Candidatus Lloydbacteria bacterium RIFCSPLOWO2_12_FULL_51_9]
MLFPKKVKHRKWQRGRKNFSKVRTESRGTTIAFGGFGMKAMSRGRIKANQIEAARKVITRSVAKGGKMWIRIFPDRPYTRKAAEVPMGKGKGDVEGYEVEVLPGRILFEIDGILPAAAKESLRKAGAKLPVKTKVFTRDE